MGGHPQDATSIDFDEGNEAELFAHGISAIEVFQLITNDPVWAPNKRGRSGMWLAIGLTDGGRALTVPIAYDETRSQVRPITGWDSTAGERTKYL